MEINQQSCSIDEALKLVKENAKAKFDESVEVHIRIPSKNKKEELNVRGVCVLPRGTGKTKRVAVFTGNETKAKQAKDAGADIVGGKDLITQIKSSGKTDFDIAVATADIMKDLAPIAKILGPRGLMPSPKTETIVDDVVKAVNELRGGKIEFKSDKTGNVHQVIGKVSFGADGLKDNFSCFIEALKKSVPEKLKSGAINNIVVTSTMGKAIKIKL